jgi:hypothetical protein
MMKEIEMEPNKQRQRDTRSDEQRTRGEGHGDERVNEAFQVTDIAVRGAALLWDLQMQTARSLWRTQARTAAMLGLPDYSELFDVGDVSARRVFSASAEQVLDSARQARNTATQVQREIVRAAEQQTLEFTEELREHLGQIGRETERGLQQFRQLAVNGTEKMTRQLQQARNERVQREQSRGNGGEVSSGESAAEAVSSSAESTTDQREHDIRRATDDSNDSVEKHAEGHERHGRRQEERHRARRGA